MLKTLLYEGTNGMKPLETQNITFQRNILQKLPW
jgi:hypothetical protein